MERNPGDSCPCPYQIDNAHLWLPLSELGGIWMRRMMLRLELQMEQASEVWIPSVMLDRPLENMEQEIKGAFLDHTFPFSHDSVVDVGKLVCHSASQ